METTKKTMSNRDKMVLFIIGAIALLAVVWFFVVAKMNEKKSALADENASLAEEVQRLETMEAQRASVEADTKECQAYIASTLAEFPSEVNTEDAIYDLNRMYTKIKDVKIASETFNMNQLFYQGGSLSDGVSDTSESTLPTEEEAEAVSRSAVTADTPVSEIVSAAADYTGYRSDVSVSFTAPYDSVKEVVDYINNAKDRKTRRSRMTITSLNMSKDESSKNLTCAMAMSIYSIEGTGNIYEEPDVSNKNVGVDNIFKKKR